MKRGQKNVQRRAAAVTPLRPEPTPAKEPVPEFIVPGKEMETLRALSIAAFDAHIRHSLAQLAIDDSPEAMRHQATIHANNEKAVARISAIRLQNTLDAAAVAAGVDIKAYQAQIDDKTGVITTTPRAQS